MIENKGMHEEASWFRHKLCQFPCKVSGDSECGRENGGVENACRLQSLIPVSLDATLPWLVPCIFSCLLPEQKRRKEKFVREVGPCRVQIKFCTCMMNRTSVHLAVHVARALSKS